MRANGSSDTSATSIGANASSASSKRSSGARVDLLVARVGDDAHEQALEPEVVDRLAGERNVPVVGWIEGAAEDPDRAAHFQIMTSSPTSTSEPGFTPAARSASSSSSPSGAVPTTRKPWPVRSTLKRRRSGGFGRYSRKAGSASSTGASSCSSLRRAEPEEQALELVDARSRRARDAVDGHDPLVLDGERRRLRVEVRLVEDDELGALTEARAVGGELPSMIAIALVGVSLGGVDHVQQQPRALEVGEELVPEPDALARALDQPRHVGDRQLPAVGAVDRAEHRRQRRERVVRDLRLRVRDPAQERGLAGVRQPRAGGVGHQLQVQLELARLARQARLGVPRRLPRRAWRSSSCRDRRRRRGPRSPGRRPRGGRPRSSRPRGS